MGTPSDTDNTVDFYAVLIFFGIGRNTL